MNYNFKKDVRLGQGRCKCLCTENPKEMLWPTSLSFSKTQAREVSWINFGLCWSRSVGKPPLSILQFPWRWNHHNIVKRSQELFSLLRIQCHISGGIYCTSTSGHWIWLYHSLPEWWNLTSYFCALASILRLSSRTSKHLFFAKLHRQSSCSFLIC